MYTFADVSLDPDGVGPAQRLREVVEEIALAAGRGARVGHSTSARSVVSST